MFEADSDDDGINGHQLDEQLWASRVLHVTF